MDWSDESCFFLLLESNVKWWCLLFSLCACNRVGGSGMDIRSKARVYSSFKFMMFFACCPVWLMYTRFRSADALRPCQWPQPTSKVELWWFEHRPSSRTGQRSDPLVCVRIPLHCDLCLVKFSSSLSWELDTLLVYSPQAIYRDPFRRGNDILVSLFWYLRFGLPSWEVIPLFPIWGNVWLLHTTRRADSHQQKTQCC